MKNALFNLVALLAGGWEWMSTGKFLSDDGHTIYRAALTGLGEREHLNGPDVDRQTHINDLDAAVPGNGMSIWDLFGGNGAQDPARFKDGFIQVPWVEPGTPPPHSVKQSIKCFDQPVSYKKPPGSRCR